MDGSFSSANRIRSLDWLAGGGAMLLALTLYGITLAPTVLEADAGEFQFVPWLPGIAHPTGYPLYVLLGWAWTHLLPWGEVAWRMNLLSAVFATITVGLTYAASRQLLDLAMPKTPPPARIGAAAVSAVTFAVTHTFWSQAIIAEVYALHALFAALILWLALKFSVSKNNQTGKILAFIFGLGLTHHSTTILLLPALLIFFWMTGAPAGQNSSLFEKIKGVAWRALIAAIPLLLYLYLPLTAASTPYATIELSDNQTLTLYDNSVQGFLKHITATVFTGELQPAAVGADRFALTWQLLRRQIGWVGALLALMGLATLWQRKCWNLLALTGISFITLVAFNLIYFIGDVFVLFIAPWLIVCLWLGIGVLAAAHWAAGRFVQRKTDSAAEAAFGQIQERLKKNMVGLTATGLSLFFFALPVTLIITQITGLDQSQNSAAADHWQTILREPIPDAAILLSNDRNEIMPMWYYQLVENRRPDLAGLFPLIVPGPAYKNVGGALDEALASNRPVYLIKPMDGLGLKANIQPEGILFRATAQDAPPDQILDTQLPKITIAGGDTTETIKLAGYNLLPATIKPGDELNITLHWQPTQLLSVNYTSYVHIIDEDGQRIAQSDHRPGGNYYPSSYWQINEILRDQHTVTIPNTIQPGAYYIRAGMYYSPEPGTITGMGNGAEVGVITVD